MKKILSILLTLMLVVGMLAGCSFSQQGNSSSTETGTYKAGTYVGVSDNGKGGRIEVTVEFDSNSILSVEVTSSSETANISDASITQIPEEIVKYQSLGIDAVSGATVTSEAILEAVADAVVQAGGDPEVLRNVVVNKEISNEVIELETDIVVVGAGAAGMSAAVSAAYEGAESVIVFEKQSNIGGNAIVSGGFIENLELDEDLKADNNPGYEAKVADAISAGPLNEDEEQYWDQLVAEYKAWQATDRTKIFDSPLWMAIEGVRTDGGLVEDYLYFAESLQEFDDWMEEMGVEWEKAHGIVGYSWPRWTSVKGYYSGEGFFHYLEKSIEDNNYPIQIYKSTPVTELLVDESGAVIGVTAQAETGETYHVKARQGVILATGGFAGNGKMLVEYNQMWDGLTEDVLSTNTAGATGDGIIMAQEIGAMTDAMEVEMMFPMADIKSGSTEAIVGASASCLMVNKEGKRFTNETGTRWDISAALFEQTDNLAYIISDNRNSQIKGGKTQGGIDVENMLANGELYMADTLEELAEKIGMDSAALQETVDSYNKMVETHEDKEFGRTTFEPNSDIVEGPFYAYPCMPAAHITIGGLVIDYDSFQVVNTEGEIIPNLFAAGEVVAGECGIDGAFAQGKALGRFVVQNVEKREFK